MDKKCIVFDVDGTLIDTRYQNCEALKVALKKKINYDITDEELYMSMGLPGEETLKKINVDVDDIKDMMEAWIYELGVFSYTVKLYEGIREILKYLKNANYKLGIVTSRCDDEIKNDAVLNEIINYFDSVVGFSNELKPKPSADQLNKVMKELNVTKEETIYIGDTIYDYYCAKNSGVEFLLVEWGHEAIDKKAFDGLTDIISYKKTMDLLIHLKTLV